MRIPTRMAGVLMGLSVVFLFPMVARAQIPGTPVFGSDTRVAPTPTNTQIRPHIVVDPYYRPQGLGTAYAVWVEGPVPSSYSDIMFSRSTDGGTNWSTPVVVNNPGQRFRNHPCIAVDQGCNKDGTLWVVWQDSPGIGGVSRIKLSISTDRGITWSSPEITVDTLAPAMASQGLARITVYNQSAWIVWIDNRRTASSSNWWDIMLTCAQLPIVGPLPPPVMLNSLSTVPNRHLFIPDIDIAAVLASPTRPTYVVWQETAPNTQNMIFSASTQYCSAPPPAETYLPRNGIPAMRTHASMESECNAVWVTYSDASTYGVGAEVITLQRSFNDGLTWSNELQVDSARGGGFRQICGDIVMVIPAYTDPILCGIPYTSIWWLYAGWIEDRSPTGWNLAVTCSASAGMTWAAPNTQVNDILDSVAYWGPRISMAGDIYSNDIYVAWTDLRDGHEQVYFDRGQ